MLSVEDYIIQQKKKDKLDEFDFTKHSENMAAVIGYVTNYFSEYLNPEDYDYERIQTEKSIEKIKKEVSEQYPMSLEFIIQYYQTHKQRVERLLKNTMRSFTDIKLFFSEEDFRNVADEFVRRDIGQTPEFISSLMILAEEIKPSFCDSLTLCDMKEMDNYLVNWVKTTHKQYGVNLIDYANDIVYEYENTYVKSHYSHEQDRHYYVNSYDYRYQDNPFDIDAIYERNCHRPFITDHKYELEMLIMHNWLFYQVNDTDYWPEYVNLCISSGRVKTVRRCNRLIPVRIEGVPYPNDVNSSITYYETNDGTLKAAPAIPYILRVGSSKKQSLIWEDEDAMKLFIQNLHAMIKEYGAPVLLELTSPGRHSQYGEVEFFESYAVLEKQMQRYSKMTISLVNGTASGRKAAALFGTLDDMRRIREMGNELKHGIKFSIDFSDSSNSNSFKNASESVFAGLSSMRNSVAAIHISSITDQGWISRDNGGRTYINTHKYYCISDFLAGLSLFMGDSRPRYLIPEKVKSADKLESMVDLLIRGGFAFQDEEQSL